ncbi:uncharacterized protein LOC123910876 [Trifolium pratense]|uniref:uncharacterized protein LOC123910876 n=1 Tax=Trifolium pratense TaxID=57577 RepID=UPI001E6909C9|nr:uncharacterized protein LOC123910876 [Trifolium pratense]XP_045818114.1 uncharacterized protein LOC123910876 [Trifolium pratense]XP_045818115.1 uncharacterized protein LOC123910876 [Trifolium pratense]XP_045818116.1 uncharacterized protein LOC123910876 [Trifolium pratense]
MVTLAAGQQGAFSTWGANKPSGANKPPLKTVKGWEMVADLFNAQMFPPDMQQHHFKATDMSCRLMFLKKQFEKVKIKPEGYGPEFLDSLKQLFKKHKLTIPQIMLDHGDEMERPSYKSPKRTPSGSSGRYKPYPRANSPYPGVNYTTPSSAATTSNACHACQPRNKIRDECSKILVSQEMNFDIIHSIMERITSEEMKKLIDCPVEHKTYFAQQLEQIYATPH